MIYLKYLKVVLRHKWYTFLECRKVGIVRLGIIHDWSKLRPSEFVPYARWFYGKRKSVRDSDAHKSKRGDRIILNMNKPDACLMAIVNINEQRMDLVPWQWKEAFDVAWNHHQKRNKHHFQYYLLTQDDDPNLVLPMPDKYRREMLADWRGAGRAYAGKDNTLEWYLERREKMKAVLHPETRAWIEDQIIGEHRWTD